MDLPYDQGVASNVEEDPDALQEEVFPAIGDYVLVQGQPPVAIAGFQGFNCSNVFEVLEVASTVDDDGNRFDGDHGPYMWLCISNEWFMDRVRLRGRRKWVTVSEVTPFPPKFNLPWLCYGSEQQIVHVSHVVYEYEDVLAYFLLDDQAFEVSQNELEDPDEVENLDEVEDSGDMEDIDEIGDPDWRSDPEEDSWIDTAYNTDRF